MTKAVILFSGGIDSTVVLSLALANNRTCHAVSFDYGQKHRQELDSAKKITKYYNVPHQVIRIDPAAFGHSSLVSDLPVPKGRHANEILTQGIPTTYVPARNTLFLAYGVGQCELLEADELHFGPNRLDCFCYPDCTPDYLKQFELLMRLATKQSVKGKSPSLVTPLIEWDKIEIIRQGLLLKSPLEMTWSCYSPENSQPCEQCDACVLRQQGFAMQKKI